MFIFDELIRLFLLLSAFCGFIYVPVDVYICHFPRSMHVLPVVSLLFLLLSVFVADVLGKE